MKVPAAQDNLLGISTAGVYVFFHPTALTV